MNFFTKIFKRADSTMSYSPFFSLFWQSTVSIIIPIPRIHFHIFIVQKQQLWKGNMGGQNWICLWKNRVNMKFYKLLLNKLKPFYVFPEKTWKRKKGKILLYTKCFSFCFKNFVSFDSFKHQQFIWLIQKDKCFCPFKLASCSNFFHSNQVFFLILFLRKKFTIPLFQPTGSQSSLAFGKWNVGILKFRSGICSTVFHFVEEND